MRCCSAKQLCKKPPTRPPVFFLVWAVEWRISISNHLSASLASPCSLSSPFFQEFLYRTWILRALSYNSLRIWKVVNKMLTRDLQTTYSDTFVMIFGAIEVSLVYVFFDIPDLILLPDTLLADFWRLRKYQEKSDGCQPR